LSTVTHHLTLRIEQLRNRAARKISEVENVRPEIWQRFAPLDTAQ